MGSISLRRELALCHVARRFQILPFASAANVEPGPFSSRELVSQSPVPWARRQLLAVLDHLEWGRFLIRAPHAVGKATQLYPPTAKPSAMTRRLAVVSWRDKQWFQFRVRTSVRTWLSLFDNSRPPPSDPFPFVRLIWIPPSLVASASKLTSMDTCSNFNGA